MAVFAFFTLLTHKIKYNIRFVFMRIKYFILSLGFFILTLLCFKKSNFNIEKYKKYNYFKKSKLEKLKNILIITMCEPTDFMLQRSIRYQKFRSFEFDVWYIFDITNNYVIPDFYKPYFEKNVYTFSSSDYIIKYPDMMDLIDNCVRIRTVRKGMEFKYLAYLSMAERVNELFQKEKFNTEFIWVVEQDSAITGNLTEIMKLFYQFKADFVVKKINEITYIYDRNVSKWKFSQCLSNKAKNFLQGKPVSISKIFFSRFSVKFMNHLNIFISSGYHGNSELIYPTVAVLNNLTLMSFPPNLVYRNSHAGTRFTKDEYYKLINTEMFAHSFKE